MKIGYEGICKYNHKTINEVEILTRIYKTPFLQVEVGTTGKQGGDTGHGGRTYFSIKGSHKEGLDIKYATFYSPYMGEMIANGFEVIAGGDWELENLKDSLMCILAVLSDSERNDKPCKRDKTKVEKCPHCGGNAKLIKKGTGYAVICCECHSRGTWIDGSSFKEEDEIAKEIAIRCWNRRA